MQTDFSFQAPSQSPDAMPHRHHHRTLYDGRHPEQGRRGRRRRRRRDDERRRGQIEVLRAPPVLLKEIKKK